MLVYGPAEKYDGSTLDNRKQRDQSQPRLFEGKGRLWVAVGIVAIASVLLVVLLYAVIIAVEDSSGGPLHKAALSTLDGFYNHGLFERDQLGHMLGTAFYPDTTLEYSVHGNGANPEKEFVRSGLWANAVMRMPFPRPVRELKDEEGGFKKKRTVFRQKICVGHLRLFALRTGENHASKSIVCDDAGRPTLRTYLALMTTEISAIIVAILVAVVWKSPFASLWLLPLTLKLISTIFAVDREQVAVPSGQSERSLSPTTVVENEEKLYEIRNPSEGFVVIEGEDDVVLQFFRHHGHPKRSWTREMIQIGIVIAFTFLFPIGLVCSTLWMNEALQKVWVGYQLYATMAMYVYRYAGGHLWTTAEEQIGETFLKTEQVTDSGDSIIEFQGHKNGGVGARLVRTCHGRFGEARSSVEELIQKRLSYLRMPPSRCSTVDSLALDMKSSKLLEEGKQFALYSINIVECTRVFYFKVISKLTKDLSETAQRKKYTCRLASRGPSNIVR